MADIRIKVAKDKAKLVKAMRAGEGSTGLFQTYYEILAFAASLGIQEGAFFPFDEKDSSREIDPIRQDQFSSKGYDQLINLIVVMHKKQPNLLEDNADCEKERIRIFEGYANGGLALLADITKGSDDLFSQLLLYVAKQKIRFEELETDSLDLESIFKL